MLVAFDRDPAACGYDAEQVPEALQAFARQGIHQESDGQEHLRALLVERGALSPEEAGYDRARAHPEVMQLRFQRERSPVDAIPNDLRKPLYRIYLQHAAGAVIRQGRLWAEFDALGEDSLVPPYRYETVGRQTAGTGGATGFCLAGLTSPEAAEQFGATDLALLPVGSLEQHGPHLTLDTDAYHAEQLSHDVAAACPLPRPLVLPTIPYGVSYHHEGFPGTVSVSPETLSRITYEIGMSLARQGITKLIIVNGHGGNVPALHFAAQRINRDANIFTCVDTGETSDVEVEALAETPNDVHAGEIETSLALAVRPTSVKPELAERQVPRFSSEFLNFSSSRSIEWYSRIERFSATGVLGDPTRATAEKGRRMWDVMVASLLALVRDLQAASLDDIYERRY
jgi:creatinine amidohydrolase/Fe(II)-dependent formamide hydrolase-like protein